jgi:hypothetical protein
MRWLVVVMLVVGCSEKKATPQPTSTNTSHTAMPNQFEVGSTINGRYLVTKKLGEVGDVNVFAVEHAHLKDKKLTMLATKTPATSINVRDAFFVELGSKKLPWSDVDVTPDNKLYYGVGELTDQQTQEILSGAYVIGR